MATKKTPRGGSPDSSLPYDTLDLLEAVEKVVKIQSVTLSDEGRLSTGLLCVDLLLGRGGLTAGMYTFAGPEQSAKTTLAITVLANSVNQDVGMRVLWDAENSSGSSADYVENIFQAAGVKANAANIFGIKKDGKYLEAPLIYYRDEGEMDTYFDWVSALLRRLPDKRFEDNRWWYVYENDRDTKARFASVMDRKLSSRNNAIYVPAKSGALQALVLTDSWPSLMPAAMDEDDPKSGMALQAREFSKNLPRVKGKLRAKRVAILGINQLREKPGVMYGCFTYQSKVLLADGSRMSIGEMVETRHPGPVLSIDENGDVQPRRVVNWFNNGETDDWLHIRYGNVSRPDGKYAFRPNSEMRVTPNHRIRMADGSFQAAGSLRIGDQVASLGYGELDTYQKQLVLGSILGDGSVTDKKSRKKQKEGFKDWRCFNPGFSIGHNSEQLSYLKWKHKMLKPKASPMKVTPGWCSFNLKNVIREDWFSSAFLETKTIRGKHVKNNWSMRLSPTIRDSIDLLGLAVWIMDDGSKNPTRPIRVKVDSYADQDFRQWIEAVNSRLGVSLRPAPQRSTGNFPDRWTYFKVDHASMMRIAPFIPKCFKKLIRSIYGQEAGRLVGSWRYEPEPTREFFSHPAIVTDIVRLKKGETRKHAGGFLNCQPEDRFDIEVEGNHTYCVDRVFVHNSPFYEPGGQALRFLSDVRIWCNPRALSGVPFNPKGKGQIEKEESIDGGEDTYRYIHLKAIKNKLSVPGLETWARIWISNSSGQAQGFCPVWDTFYAMAQSGMVSGKRSSMTLDVPGLGPAKKNLNWLEFKKLVMGTKEQKEAVCSKIGYRAIDLRSGLVKMAKSGRLESAFLERARSGAKAVGADDDDDEKDADEV